MRSGRFIVFDGPDGAGKSTQLRETAAWIRDRGQALAETREPGGSELAEAIRALILNAPGPGMCGESELLLMFAARHSHLRDTVIPSLAAGMDVLCDRYVDSSYAYQGGGRGVSWPFIDTLVAALPADALPDRVLLFDIPDGLAEQRMQDRGALDRFDNESTEFRQRVRSAYRLRLQQSDPDGRYQRVDATGSVAEVQQRVRAALADLYPEPA